MFTNGLSLDDELDAVVHLGARIVNTRIARIEADGVVLTNGEERRCERLFVPTEVHRSSPLAEQLGCAVRDEFVEVDELGRTSVPRVYAAGDAASPAHQAILAAASGTRAGLAANHDSIESFEID